MYAGVTLVKAITLRFSLSHFRCYLLTLLFLLLLNFSCSFIFLVYSVLFSSLASRISLFSYFSSSSYFFLMLLLTGEIYVILIQMSIYQHIRDVASHEIPVTPIARFLVMLLGLHLTCSSVAG